MRTRPEPGGRVLVRMPRSLHAELVALAECEGVSLNQLAVTSLARTAARSTDGAASTITEHDVAVYETADRLRDLERLLQLLRDRLEQLEIRSLPAIEEALRDISAELSEPDGFLAGIGASLKAPVGASAPADDAARKERIKGRARAHRR